MEKKRLTRKIRDRQWGGVASGLAEYFNVDVTLIRLGFALLTLINGFGVVLYLVMWLLMPNIEQLNRDEEQIISSNAKDIVKRSKELMESLVGSNAPIVGIALLGLGILFLLNQLIPSLSFGMVFAIALVIMGILLVILQRSNE